MITKKCELQEMPICGMLSMCQALCYVPHLLHFAVFPEKKIIKIYFLKDSSHPFLPRLLHESPIHTKYKVKLFSCVQLFATPWTVAQQASLSMGFSRQEYWRRLPFPSPGDLPDPGIKLGSPALQADALLSLSHQGSLQVLKQHKSMDRPGIRNMKWHILISLLRF